MKSHTARPPHNPARTVEIAQYFGNLPPTHFRQALNVRNTITSLDSTQSGYWQDILTAENAPPWLQTHEWLLNAYQVPAGADRIAIENNLYLGMYFTYLNFWLEESIRATDSVFGPGYQSLAGEFKDQAKRYFQQLLPTGHPFWLDVEKIDEARQEAIVWQKNRQTGDNISFETADWQHYADYLAPTKLSTAALLHLIDKTEDLQNIWQMNDYANQAFRIQEDVLAIRRDLLNNHLTYPIMRTMQLAGMTTQRPFNPETIMGTAILTGSIKKVCANAVERIEKSKTLAEKFNIPGWSTYCKQLQLTIESLHALFSLKSGTSSTQKHTFLPYRDIMGQSLNMASAYLLSDPAFSESVETNRGGLEELGEAKGIIFPLSFITYLLLENGHDLGSKVAHIFSKMESLGYRYYENMAVAPDTDEIAILLRLFKHSPNQEQHHRQLERPLKWLMDNVQPDGSIPAFWFKVDIPLLERMVVWENYCLTAEINTLLGLIAYDWPRFQSLIEKASVGVFGRYLDSDFGTVAYYDPLYTLWQTLALVRQLAGRTADSNLTSLIAEASEKLKNRFVLETERGTHSPQQTAFLIMACLDGNLQDCLDTNWISTLQKTQRFDGSWDNEPFFITCDRDGLPGNWYSSRTMTTAFCYHALNSYQKRMNPL